MYKLPPFPLPRNVVLAMMLVYRNPVVFKTTLKEERREDMIKCLYLFKVA